MDTLKIWRYDSKLLQKMEWQQALLIFHEGYGGRADFNGLEA